MKKRFTYFITLTTVCCIFLIYTAQCEKISVEIAYKVKDYDIPIKIVAPEKGKGPFPVVFHVRGGGWNGGPNDKVVPSPTVPRGFRFLCDELGIVFVGLAYRCKPQGIFEDAMEDLHASIEWFEKNKKRFHADTSTFGISGGSAGTTLSSLLAQQLPNCKTYVGLYGVYNFLDNEESYFPSEQGFADYGLAEQSQKLAASAYHNLSSNPPTSLLFHGGKDLLTHPSQSVSFAEKLKKIGGVSEAIIYPEVNHGFYDPRYPSEFKDATLRIAKLYADNLILDRSRLDNVETKLNSLVSEFGTKDTIHLQDLLGVWKGKHDTYFFQNDHKGQIINKKNIKRPMSYQINGSEIILNNNKKKIVLKMYINSRCLYFTTKDGKRWFFEKLKPKNKKS